MSVPPGISHPDAARQAVAEFLAHPPLGEFGEVQSVETVRLRSDHGDVESPGISLQWRQGQAEFGLLMPIDRLAEQAGGLDSVPIYLHVAVDEPHSSSGDGSRTWFTDLPSGPY